MSRNFELTTPIESEFVAKPDRVRAAQVRTGVKAVLPTNVGGPGSDAMQRLVQTMFLAPNGNPPRQVVFCGVDSEGGSSSVCADLGKALASSNSGSVCLVDANLRLQRLSALLGVDPSGSFLSKSLSARERCAAIGENLWLAGQDFVAGDRAVLPSAVKIKHLFAELRAAFDFILIDAPGARVSGDASILGQVSDGTVLVIEANDTRRDAARKAKEALEAMSVRLLGTILHNRSFPVPQSIYDRL